MTVTGDSVTKRFKGEHYSEDANCQQAGQIWFYPEKGESDLSNTAVRICHGQEPGFPPCPVIKECFAELLAHDTVGSVHGVWAGLNTKQARRAWREAKGEADDG
jgi:Transcription factor WhiB